MEPSCGLGLAEMEGESGGGVVEEEATVKEEVAINLFFILIAT